MKKENADIREAAKEKGVYLWQIAERLGISDNTFNRKLRKELPSEEKKAVFDVITATKGAK